MKRTAFGVSILYLSGCASLFGNYEPLKMSVSGDEELVSRALGRYLDFRGWVLDDGAGDDVLFEALSAVEDDMGVPSRERWVFKLEGEQLSVSRSLEVLFDLEDGTWTTSSWVCDSYSYERERSEVVALGRYLESTAFNGTDHFVVTHLAHSLAQLNTGGFQ